MQFQNSENRSFKQKVKESLILCARIYKNVLMDYEYLVCSPALVQRPFYVFYTTKDNFLHLTGVNTELKASEFFQKCIEGTLVEDDFDFNKSNQTEKETKGCVRLKMKVLPRIADILLPGALIEEQFVKGRISCNFATATSQLTLGFVAPGKARPKTLLLGNYAKNGKPVELLLRKPTKEEKFSEVLIGNRDSLLKYYPSICLLVDADLLK